MERQNSIIMFLGAGASAEAEVPVMKQLAAMFDEEIKARSDNMKSAYESITTAIKEEGKHTVTHKNVTYADLEAVLATVRSVRDAPDNFAHPFLDRTALGGVSDKCLQSLEREIRSFIRERMRPNTQKLKYLYPIAEIARKLSSLDIFSANYDTCVEHVFEDLDVSYTDGFGARWDPLLFDVGEHLVRLHKLHGSTNWFQQSGAISKLYRYPVLPSRADSLSDEQELAELMVYPLAPKGSLETPWIDLFNRLDKALATAHVCIVVGYSFRDEYIRNLFLKNMEKNQRLRILVVDREASSAVGRLLAEVMRPESAVRLAAKCQLLPVKASDAMAWDGLYHGSRQVIEVEALAEELLRSPHPQFEVRARQTREITNRLLSLEWYPRLYTWLVERRTVERRGIAVDPAHPRSIPALLVCLLLAAAAGDRKAKNVFMMEFRHHFRDSLRDSEVKASQDDRPLLLRLQRWEKRLSLSYLTDSAAAARESVERSYFWKSSSNMMQDLVLELAEVMEKTHKELEALLNNGHSFTISSTNSWNVFVEPFYNKVIESVEKTLAQG